jgi:hypothetical protein
MLFICSSCRFQTHILGELKSHLAKHMLNQEEKRKLDHESKIRKALEDNKKRVEGTWKRKAEEAEQNIAASEVDGSEKRRRLESSFICSSCHSALLDKNSFQIHLFGRHGELWCEMCNFEGKVSSMSAHLLAVHGQVLHPSCSSMIEWNAQYNKERDNNCIGSPSSQVEDDRNDDDDIADVYMRYLHKINSLQC